MKILYQSELTGKTYDNKEALVAAEQEFTEAQKAAEVKKQERAAAAKEVENKLKLASEAQEEARKALTAFCDKYGTFKTTLEKGRDWIFDPWAFFRSFL